MEFKYFTKFTASDVPSEVKETNVLPNSGGENKILLKGILIDESENKNRWRVEQEDFQHLAQDFIGKQIRLDHQEKVSGVVGKILSTEIDEPHSEQKEAWDPPTKSPHIHFVGEAVFTDSNVVTPIRLGYITHISPAVDSLKILCSECRAPMKYNGYSHVKSCQCEDGTKLLKELSAREMSLVVSPAYSSTVVVPYGFAAACDDSFLSEDKVLSIVEDELKKRGVK